MAQVHYEITYIIKPDIAEEDKKALIERFDKVLKDNGAEVVDSKDWQKRHFAYEIGGYNEGTYHIINVKVSEQTAINEFDRLAKIDDSILRHMIIRRED